MKNQKNERGITLVALVVTIVVLLILAGITIMYVMSDNGVFGQAKSAGSETEKSAVREAVMLSINANVLPQLYTTEDNSTTVWTDVFERGLYSGMKVAKQGTVTASTTEENGVTKTTVTIAGYVIENGKGYYSVNYNNTSGLTVEATTAPTP